MIIKKDLCCVVELWDTGKTSHKATPHKTSKTYSYQQRQI